MVTYMIDCPQCDGSGFQPPQHNSMLRLYCERCHGVGRIIGGFTDASWPWPEKELLPSVADHLHDLERRVARLESTSRRWPRRKTVRRR